MRSDRFKAAPSPAQSEPGAEHRHTRRPLVLGAIILGMFMVAIEGTIVSTAMPSIVADLGGFSLFSWVFSIYLLLQAVTIPIYGKLADLFGRKPVYAFGVALFIIGSILCGFAPSMGMLIAARLIQGIGAGAVQPIATTIVGDMYSLQERAKVQGYLGSVWGISSIIGPALGGFFVQYWDWAWVFWINIPFGILSAFGVSRFLRETVEKKRHRIDYTGSVLLVAWIGALMLVLTMGGVVFQWMSVPTVLLLAVCIIGFVLFLLQERRHQNPLLPLALWRNRLITVANIASLTTGAVMMGVISFLPSFVQGVMERSPTVAGFTLSVMSIGWPLSSTLAGKMMVRTGFRTPALIGGCALVTGTVCFLTLDPNSGPVRAGIGSFFIGTGMGFTTTTFIVSIQHSVGWMKRGVATASNMFMRILGNTVGVALFAGILNTQLHAFLSQKEVPLPVPADVDVANLLFDPAERARLPEDTVQHLQEGLNLALHSVYWGVLIVSVATIGIVLFLPKQVKTEPAK